MLLDITFGSTWKRQDATNHQRTVLERLMWQKGLKKYNFCCIMSVPSCWVMEIYKKCQQETRQKYFLLYLSLL